MWILAAAVGLILVIFSRRLRGWVLLIAWLACAFLLIQNLYPDNEYAETLSGVQHEEVEIEDLNFDDCSAQFCTLRGRIRNLSTNYIINWITLKFTFDDCSASETQDDCVRVFESATNIFSTIPPQETRDIEKVMDLTDLDMSSFTAWHYHVDRISAEYFR